eukprot:CAMPEP_0185595724 /NCGR_PEP_ID=MMETSP0434-20130131/79295_1 /TAXON_ID=626734 ORGANISM="Favella taraikaensis, Strain Fe Narragansett Bay" /NCGR_SAMPLE_ID=MMETSP0434 /ASSEMBLY_ACC=CAM_ASM_000379 /LENGTH=108 /DNA_ID=CAMNT_0028223909 /DNA_START=601 /DNA_END=927 /DNA_ORIENTATION=-
MMSAGEPENQLGAGARAQSRSNSASAHPLACSYSECIIVQSEILEEVIKIKRKQNSLEAKAAVELKKRLKASYGEVKDKVVQGTPSFSSARNRARGRVKAAMGTVGAY